MYLHILLIWYSLPSMKRGSITTTHPSADSLLDDDRDQEPDSPVDGCRSLSCLTDSTDHSAPLNFDMSNRVSIHPQ